ncbi:hypothetical protein, partial [Martelella mediterranea]|uniref:hypothetical protein n=1 Tax=Martelella mediterranea TaxID=293089 RepID=UPI001A9E78F9
VGLEKPRRFRTESGLNENLGRNETVTGPAGVIAVQEHSNFAIPDSDGGVIDLERRLSVSVRRCFFGADWQTALPIYLLLKTLRFRC